MKSGFLLRASGKIRREWSFVRQEWQEGVPQVPTDARIVVLYAAKQLLWPESLTFAMEENQQGN
jgi:hypothetical protein